MPPLFRPDGTPLSPSVSALSPEEVARVNAIFRTIGALLSFGLRVPETKDIPDAGDRGTYLVSALFGMLGYLIGSNEVLTAAFPTISQATLGPIAPHEGLALLSGRETAKAFGATMYESLLAHMSEEETPNGDEDEQN